MDYLTYCSVVEILKKQRLHCEIKGCRQWQEEAIEFLKRGENKYLQLRLFERKTQWLFLTHEETIGRLFQEGENLVITSYQSYDRDKILQKLFVVALTLASKLRQQVELRHVGSESINVLVHISSPINYGS